MTTFGRQRPIADIYDKLELSMSKFIGKTIIFIAVTMLFVSTGICDTWSFPKKAVETVYQFGETKIIKTVDGRNNDQYPDYIIDIYDEDKLVAKYRGVSFQHLAASNNGVFIGISNDGLPGTAFVIFDSKGNLKVEAKHNMYPFHYCRESITRVREWFDDDNPKLRYVYSEDGEFDDIIVNGCNGKEIKIIEHVFNSKTSESTPGNAN